MSKKGFLGGKNSNAYIVFYNGDYRCSAVGIHFALAEG